MKRFSMYCILLFPFLYAQEQEGNNRICSLIIRSRVYHPTHPVHASFAKSALKDCRSPVVRQSMKTIIQAWRFLSGVKGFAQTLIHLNRQVDGVNGHLFEVEAAVESYEKGEQVLALNEHVVAPDNSSSKEFDVISVDPDGTKKYIECKDINWNNASGKRKKQLQQQAAIVRGYQDLGNPAQYILYSKRPIPSKWKRWLTNNQITYEEQDKK